MTPLDYLVEVARLKSIYGEEDDDLIAEQFRINHSPQVVDHQERPILDFFVPRRKRTMRREVTQQSFCNGIKKAVENSDDRGNRVFKINSKGSDVIRKRLVTDPPLGFKNQERKRKKRNIIVRPEVPAPVRELNMEFKNLITFIGGSLESVKLVIEKTLFQTDVKPAEGRFSIPQKKMINSFLELEEDAHLSTRNGGKMNEMRVMLIEPSRRVSEINLRKWFMNKDNGKTNLSYVLVTYWNEVVRKNGLKVGTTVQLWAFRQGTGLGFALVKLQD